MARFEFITAGKKGRPTGWGGKAFLTVFFGVFLIMGSGAVVAVLHQSRQVFDTYDWQETPCTIITSKVDEDPSRDNSPYRLELTYAYDVAGKRFVSDCYRHEYRGGKDYSKVLRLAHEFKPNSGTVCYVDPADPQESVLRRRSRAFAFVALFPMIFVAIGAGGLYFTWRGRRRKRPDGTPAPEAISEKSNPRVLRWLPLGVFAVFLLAGCGVLFGLFVPMFLKIEAAKGWQQTPCVVEDSRVRKHEGDSDSGPTYSVEILYRYEFGGVQYKSSRYAVIGGSSSGRDAKQQVANAHPRGKETVCYVDPEDPYAAALKRGYSLWMLFALLPLVFIAVGGVGTFCSARSALRQTAAERRPSLSRAGAASAPGVPVPDTEPGAGPVVLVSRRGPLKTLALVTAFALFWNGITSVFVYQVVQSFIKGDPEWFLAVFMIPFVLVGLGFTVGIFYCLLTLFNPRPKLTVSSATAPLGGEIEVEWVLQGRSSAVRRLTVEFEGEESATYQRGTDTHTDTETFATIDVADVTDRREIFAGSAVLHIPDSTMHSFKANNNKIVWQLHVHGDIARWPDVDEKFEIVVLPAAPEGSV